MGFVGVIDGMTFLPTMLPLSHTVNRAVGTGGRISQVQMTFLKLSAFQFRISPGNSLSLKQKKL